MLIKREVAFVVQKCVRLFVIWALLNFVKKSSGFDKKKINLFCLSKQLWGLQLRNAMGTPASVCASRSPSMPTSGEILVSLPPLSGREGELSELLVSL